MRRSWFVSGVVVGVLAGVAISWAGRKVVDPGLYTDVEPREAGKALLQLAREDAGKGSWERIAVARFYILGGERALGEEIIGEVLGHKPEASDWMRIGRVWAEAGDWARARDMFVQVVEAKPKDSDWLAEIGAYYNLNGEREKAEELFLRSFEEEADDYENLAIAGGSYMGVKPGR